jgi:eukaryotic-like serine/threonine-protein kinase
MGEVYRARDQRLGRDVALKVLPDVSASHPERLRRFEREARATAALSHPNVITVFDAGSQDGRGFVVTELLNGSTLGDRLHGDPLSTRDALTFAAQAARGLGAAHSRGIVHRDVKPDNLFITTAGVLKVLDFGLAHLAGDSSGAERDSTESKLTSAGAVLGTIRYMSPEQAKGLAVDSRSDLFSLGVVLCEMLSGRHPFQRPTSAETISAILRDDPPTEPLFTPVLDKIIRRCLEKDPDERFQSARDLEFALSTLAGSSSVDIAGPSVEPKPRRRWLARLAVVLAALTLVTGGLFIGQRLGESPLPSFQRLTFRRGDIWNACFAPDGQTIVYGASWDGQPWRLFTTRIGSRESRPLDLPDADIQAISRSGEMAILVKLPHPRTPGSPVTLARVSMAGGAPREVLDGVVGADFSPDGQNLAVVRELGGRRQLEYPIGKVLFQGDVWNYPRVSPNGELVAVDTASGLSVVDRQGRRTILDEKGWASSWSPTGNEVWFTAPNEAGTNDSIYAVTLSGRKRVLVSSASSSRLRAVSRDGRALMTSGGFRAVMMALALGATRERDVSWFDLSSVADLARDGSELLFQEGGAAGAETMATYLRRTDGSSPAVRIGEGQPMSLSFDGKWVLMKGDSPAPELSILPTGAGESRVLAGQGIEYDWAYFFPDGRRIIAIARRVGEPWRAYIQDLAGGPPRPFLPQGVSPGAISPDSRLVVGLDDATRTIRLYPADGGEPRSVPGPPEPGDPVSWSTDGRSLFCVETHGLVMKIFRRELGSGRRDLLREITPTDPAGIFQLQRAIPAADGRSYAYSYWRQITDLYVVDGLR